MSTGNPPTLAGVVFIASGVFGIAWMTFGYFPYSVMAVLASVGVYDLTGRLRVTEGAEALLSPEAGVTISRFPLWMSAFTLLALYVLFFFEIV